MKHSEEKTAAPKPQSESVFRDDIREAVRVMQSGGVILYPTDTIWGIGCDACNEDAVRRVFEIKRRAEAKSVISLVDSEVKVEFYVRSVPDVAWQLWECSDEPLTLVLDGARNLASGVIASDGSVALRVTREAFSRQLCMRMKRAIVSTSANIAGEPAPRCFSEISPEILQAVDYVCLSRRDEAPRQTPSHIIKIGPSGEVKIIR
ncbi:MAG: L-threonylcarbamoyladenylate synthase [Prevotellamassilia sp.]|nr:threonylcarbamoyl-AMP synthase [Bacteroidales bacterium]MDD6538399.1 L-threonylcarbamoyladenylate synthase [Bacteroidales bacterium]MDD7525475.1 L-threonylcarbamoyladenylate synthase [Bacteroidales bacterium]MDY5770172.1 L-threonylcarbamoyladenylate synthase [Alloprevotella sp.]MEE1270600.1 L-threonylcarbamoyladenylate synthase [Prevotellamassilia sp.]